MPLSETEFKRLLEVFCAGETGVPPLVPTVDKHDADLRRALDEDSGEVVPTIDELAASLGVAVERVDRVVFDQLASLRTIHDVRKSSIFLKSGKEAMDRSFAKAFDTNGIRTLATQGINRQLVKPTEEELNSAYGRTDLRGLPKAHVGPWQRMSEHPFFSSAVSLHFLCFSITPDGNVRFLGLEIQRGTSHGTAELLAAVGNLRTQIGDHVEKQESRQERRARDRMRRKLEKRQQQEAKAAAAPTGDGAELRAKHDAREAAEAEQRKAQAAERRRLIDAERAQREARADKAFSASGPSHKVPTAASRATVAKSLDGVDKSKRMSAKEASLQRMHEQEAEKKRIEAERAAEAHERERLASIGHAIQHGH